MCMYLERVKLAVEAVPGVTRFKLRLRSRIVELPLAPQDQRVRVAQHGAVQRRRTLCARVALDELHRALVVAYDALAADGNQHVTRQDGCRIRTLWGDSCDHNAHQRWRR